MPVGGEGGRPQPQLSPALRKGPREALRLGVEELGDGDASGGPRQAVGAIVGGGDTARTRGCPRRKMRWGGRSLERFGSVSSVVGGGGEGGLEGEVWSACDHPGATESYMVPPCCVEEKTPFLCVPHLAQTIGVVLFVVASINRKQ